MLSLRTMGVTCLLVVAFHVKRSAAYEPTSAFDAFPQVYQAQIRPLVAKHCDECHSGDLIESQIDLGGMPLFADVRQRPEVWQRVYEALRSRQMPPADADPQLSDADRDSLLKWLREYLPVEAALRDGDPGRVV